MGVTGPLSPPVGSGCTLSCMEKQYSESCEQVANDHGMSSVVQQETFECQGGVSIPVFAQGIQRGSCKKRTQKTLVFIMRGHIWQEGLVIRGRGCQ